MNESALATGIALHVAMAVRFLDAQRHAAAAGTGAGVAREA